MKYRSLGSCRTATTSTTHTIATKDSYLLQVIAIDGFAFETAETAKRQYGGPFENWGYSAESAILIGALEMFAGVLVLVPHIALYGCMTIIVLMIGAIYTHLSTAINSPLFAVIYALMAVALGMLRYGVAFKPKR